MKYTVHVVHRTNGSVRTFPDAYSVAIFALGRDTADYIVIVSCNMRAEVVPIDSEFYRIEAQIQATADKLAAMK